jgi:hypothetical protein
MPTAGSFVVAGICRLNHAILLVTFEAFKKDRLICEPYALASGLTQLSTRVEQFLESNFMLRPPELLAGVVFSSHQTGNSNTLKTYSSLRPIK